MGTKYTISRRVFFFMLNGSSVGMGIAFVYYAFIIDSIPDLKDLIDIVFYISLIVFLLSGFLKLIRRVNE